MPWALLFIGLIFMVAAVKGNHGDLFKLLKKDMTGSDNFIVWVMSIVFLVLIGNIKSVKPIADSFILLLLIALVLSSRKSGKNIFADFISQIKEGTS